MAGYFEATGGPGGGAALALDETEISILRSLAVQLLELIGPGEAGAGDGGGSADPLEALLADGPSEPPRDPALARLFPDAYGEPGRQPDEETRRLSSEFRRFTEGELRARKRDDLLTVVHALDELMRDAAAPGGAGAAVLTLRPEESGRWLGALNDLRLALAVRLDIGDDDATDRLFGLPEGHPDKPMAIAYLWLGGLQESLLETLHP